MENKQQNLFGEEEIVDTKYGELHKNDKYVWKVEPIYEEKVPVIEAESVRKVKIELMGERIKDNENGDPIAKQSDRNMVQRASNGDVFTFKNKRTGKLDVIQRHYQPSKITNTAKAYGVQINNMLPKDWKPFEKYVHIVSMTFVFSPLKSFSKKKMDQIEAGVVFEKRTKPDLDNLIKMLKDVLQNNNIFTNDSLVSKYGEVSKVYGMKPKIIIYLKGE